MQRKTLKVAAASAVTVGALVAGGATIALAADATPTPSPSASADKGTDGADGDGKRGGHAHTEVTGDEADKVVAAVEAKDSAVTVESVRKDEDGSYDAMGTRDGEKVAFEVSADLATITERTGGKGGRHGSRGGADDRSTSPDDAGDTAETSATATAV